MILFKEDWNKYPEAIPDLKTKNRSFVRMAGIYKSMGIKNHMFLLALHDQRLIGFDPHDEKLPTAIKLLMIKEVKVNPWYFFREVMRVPPPAGNESIMLTANRANIATLWLAFNHITSFLIQPRQTGKSLIGNALDVLSLNTTTTNTALTILTKDDKLRAKTARDMKSLIKLLPPFFQQLTNKDIANSERITVKSLKNVLNIFVGQKDKKAADALGRGDTLPIVRIDEFAYIYNIGITLPVLLSATTAAREVAEKTNSPFYTLFTTTPGKLNTADGRFAHEVYNESLRWSEKFMDSDNLKELKKIISVNSKRFEVVLTEFNHRQLGFTDDWLRARLKAALSSGDAAESDFFNKWVNGTTTSPIPKPIMKIITDSKKNSIDNFISKYGFAIRLYITNREFTKLKREGFIIIGLDTSDALGGKNDDIGLVMRNSATGEVIGVGLYNQINLATFADFLVELLEDIPNSMLIPERKSSAMAILDIMFRIMVVKRINPFKRIFNLVVNNATSPQDSHLQGLITKMPSLEDITKHKRSFGYATSSGGATSRGILFRNVFRASFTYTADKVYDSALITQLAGLKIMNNRIDHESGSHDDLVIAWLLAYYVLQYGKNTSVYGLKDSLKLTTVIDSELVATQPDVTKEKLARQVTLKNQLTNLINEITNDADEVITRGKIKKVRYLATKIDTSIITNINVDNMLKDIKIYRSIQNNNARHSELAA